MAYSSWIAALAGSAMLASSLPASAQVVRFDPSLTRSASPLMTDVQFRHGGGGVRRLPGNVFGRGGHFGHRGGFGGRRFGYGGGYHHGWRGGRGAAIGAGVAGLAAGALIGGALASGPAYGYGAPGYVVDPNYAAYPGPVYAAPPATAGDASAYCAQRFKSYDPASGTYLGYDGQRHPCP